MSNDISLPGIPDNSNIPAIPAKKEQKRVLADGPIQLGDFNPKGKDRFKDRLCMTCESPIMGHWVIEDNDPELMGLYWCDKTKTQYSEGMKD